MHQILEDVLNQSEKEYRTYNIKTQMKSALRDKFLGQVRPGSPFKKKTSMMKLLAEEDKDKKKMESVTVAQVLIESIIENYGVIAE